MYFLIARLFSAMAFFAEMHSLGDRVKRRMWSCETESGYILSSQILSLNVHL